MKWLGALLCLTAATWIGFEWSRKLNERPKHIRQLKNALQILEAEILYSQLPLKDVFLVISKQIPKPLNSFFYNLNLSMQATAPNLDKVWDSQLSKLNMSSSLGKNEKEILGQFGKTLGQHDFHQQQKQIHLAISHLERELQDARDEQYKYGKMAKSLGFLCGLFIVILLI